jgi:hypothetical protein
MPRACTLCAYRDQAAVRAAFAAGLSDRAIGRQFGLTHPAVAHHRREHMLKPLTAAVAALDKGVAQRQQRKEQLAAISEGDPTAIAAAIAAFSASRQLGKITAAEARLSRLADKAEASGAVATATQVVGQQLKSVEIGSRIAQTGGYAPPRTPAQPAEGSRWTIQMVFPNAGKVEEINITTAPTGQEADIPQMPPTIEGRCAPISPKIDTGMVARVVNQIRRSEPKQDDDQSED